MWNFADHECELPNKELLMFGDEERTEKTIEQLDTSHIVDEYCTKMGQSAKDLREAGFALVNTMPFERLVADAEFRQKLVHFYTSHRFEFYTAMEQRFPGL